MSRNKLKKVTILRETNYDKQPMIGQKFNSFQNLINNFTPSNCSSNTLYFHNIFHNII